MQTNKNLILCFGVTAAIFLGCSDKKSQSTNTAGGITKVILNMPSTTSFTASNATATANLQAVVYSINPRTTTCSAYKKYVTETFVSAKSVTIDLLNDCDYDFSMSMGKSTAGTTSMEVYYQTSATVALTSVQLKQYQTSNMTISYSLSLTTQGQQIGFTAPSVPISGTSSTTLPSTTTGLTTTYDKDIRPLLERYCTSCHKAGGSRSSSDLTTYSQAYQYKDASVSMIVQKTMPPPTSATMTATEIQLFQSWQSQGYKQN